MRVFFTCATGRVNHEDARARLMNALMNDFDRGAVDIATEYFVCFPLGRIGKYCVYKLAGGNVLNHLLLQQCRV